MSCLTLCPWSSLCFLLQILIWDSLLKVASSSDSPEIADCIQRCPPGKESVCGTDGKTYLNDCQLKCWKAVKSISGPCTKCLTQKAEKEREKQDVFILACDAQSGNYLASQCHGQTGYCWCVNVDNGKPIPGSSVRGKSPNCDRITKKAGRKRRPRRGERKKCLEQDRNVFSANLVNIFVSEHKRIRKWANESSLNQTRLSQDAVRWKFMTMDLNKDGFLSRAEVRDFRRMIIKIIRPRPCARIFVRTCDRDSDKLISKAEWGLCLGPSPSSPNPSGFSKNLLGGAASRAANSTPGKRPSPFDMVLMLSSGPTSGGIPLLQSSSESGQESREEDDDEDKQSEEKGIQLSKNCSQSKKNGVENSLKNPSSVLFIPDCSPVNSYLYNEIQCHKATGYCWCVNVNNGHPIVGTSSFMQTPNCKQVRKAVPFQGCSFKRKQKFLAELMAKFEAEMKKEVNNGSTKSIAVVKWKFAKLDLDKSKRLDKNEWKIFKKSGFDSSFRGKNLRKCWRNFVRFCDFDTNGIIDENEWISCCGERDDAAEFGGKRRDGPLLKTRRGPNPFSTILKAD